MSNRSRRIAEEIKREMTDIVRNEIDDPRIDALISITDVEVTTDMSYATVYVSKIGTPEERDELINVLNKARGFVRTLLSKRLKTRTVPEITFKLDDSLLYGAHIEKLLNDLGE